MIRKAIARLRGGEPFPAKGDPHLLTMSSERTGMVDPSRSIPSTTAGKANREERILLAGSAATTLTLAFLGVIVGLLAGAKSIVFDGMYDAVDAGMTVIAFATLKLIARGDDRQFQFGYWHLEPLLAFLNGSVLLVACVYGVIDGVGALLAGGREIGLDAGIAYASFGTAVSLVATIIVSRAARRLDSTLLRLDARTWLVGTVLSTGLLFSFGAASFLEGSMAAALAKYVDPVVLVVLALVLAPIPIATLFQAGREILHIAPADLDEQVSTIAGDLAARHGFVDHRSYVSRVGRAQFIEIGFVAPTAASTWTMGELDAVRQEIADRMGGLRPGYWLTVDFTADLRWI